MASTVKRIVASGGVDRLPWMSKVPPAPFVVEVARRTVLFGLHEGDVCCVEAESGVVTKLSDLTTKGCGVQDEDVCAFWCGGDGSSLYVATARQLVRRWILEWEGSALVGAALECTVKAHKAPVKDVDVDGSGCLVATGASDGFAKVMDSRRKCCVTHSFPHGGVVVDMVRHHPDRATLVLASAAGSCVFLWDLADQAKRRKLDTTARASRRSAGCRASRRRAISASRRRRGTGP